MLTDRQIVTLSLLTAAINSQQFYAFLVAENREITERSIKNLRLMADIFLEITAEIPHNAENDGEMQAIIDKLKNNNQALMRISESINFNPVE